MSNTSPLVYTDGVHIMCEDLKTLHAFCSSIGIKRCWFDSNPNHPHYDKPKTFNLIKAIQAGAVMVTSRELVKLYRGWSEEKRKGLL